MPSDFSDAENVIYEALGEVFPAAQVEVRVGGEVALAGAYGWIDPETRRQPLALDTPFDLASVTKLFVVTTFMTLVEAGAVALDQPVSSVLPAFSGRRPIEAYEDPLQSGAWIKIEAGREGPETVDAGTITFRHLLSHNSGLPAWRPLFKTESAEAAREMALSTAFAYPTGARVIYSDIGLILLGMAVAQLDGRPLEQAVTAHVVAPLGLEHTAYRPLAVAPLGAAPPAAAPLGAAQAIPAGSVVPTEVCKWRGRRLQGEVHDENAARLGGVSGHAGLFSTASDLARFGQVFLDAGRPLLSAPTVAEMTRLQAEDDGVRRGLGFALWSPDLEASSNPFGPRTFGHTGFTGTSLWIDPDRSLTVALLTNRVYYGRDAAGITRFRVAFGRALVNGV